MSNFKRDDIVEEVRKSREKSAKKEESDPVKFHRDTRRLAEKLGIKRSTLKPIKLDFSKFRKKTENVA